MKRRRLTIIEGPDGGGKTTYATTLAKRTNARLVHSGPFPWVSKNLGRLYVEAMLPALLGYQDVVLDRAWPSEPVYSMAHRGSTGRLPPASQRMLDRIAARCATQVVFCLPPKESCLKVFEQRRDEEYLKNPTQLSLVYDEYVRRYENCTLTQLPTVHYDYTRQREKEYEVPTRRTPSHYLAACSAGFYDAPVVLVGDTLAEVKDSDPLFRAPFVSFDTTGCSTTGYGRWLTDRLASAGICESQLLWTNADDHFLGRVLREYPRKAVFALGGAASDRLSAMKVLHQWEKHPQYWKRFHASVGYPLIQHLKETLNV